MKRALWLLLLLAVWQGPATAGAQSPPVSPTPSVNASALNAPAALVFADSIQQYETDPLTTSVVRVYVSHQPFDVISPWRKKGVEINQISGTVVPGGAILVTADSLVDATYVEMSKAGESARYELVTTFVDPEVNLALLEPKAPLALPHLTPLELSGMLPFSAACDAVGWQAGQLYRTHARVVDIGMRHAPTSAYWVATYRLDASDMPHASSPLVRHGRLAGLVDETVDHAAYAIPATIIRHFLHDSPDTKYRGFAAIGLTTEPLVSPETRSLLKAPTSTGGVRVVKVNDQGPCANLVRTNDVLLKVEGLNLDDHGRYRHPVWGRVSYQYLLNERRGGDKIRLTVLRDGKPLTFTVTLSRFHSQRALERPPLRRPGARPYLIFGGLVFQELDRTYLESWGRDWQDEAPVALVMAARRTAEKSAADSGVIVLTRVLADDFNQGYENITNQIVDQVNGRRIHTLEDLEAALSQAPVKRAGKEYAVISLAYDQGLIVLRSDGLGPVHRRIAAKYAIDASEAFFPAVQ